MKTAILAIFLFLIMIFPHELGHFIAARRCDVQVNEFAFGMGPVLWKKQKGETLYSIRLFPIGGFCGMEGEDGSPDEEETDENGEPVTEEYNPRSFNNKKPWQKIVILAAGAFMNVVSAFLILTVVTLYLGFNTTVIGEVSPGYPAEQAGIETGDKILSANGHDIENWNDLSPAIQESDGNEIAIEVLRNGETMTFRLTPSYDEESGRYVIGTMCRVSHDPIKAVKSSFIGTFRLFKVMFQSLGMLISGEATIQDVSGPVGIVQMVGETSSQGLWSFGFLMALICINLAVINMLPLPALDGGRIIIVLFSWITGKAVSPKVEGIIHTVGLVALLLLAAVVTFNDIGKLFN